MSSEEYILNGLIKCIGHGGGYQNKTAFMDCLMEKRIGLKGQEETLYEWMRSKKGCDF